MLIQCCIKKFYEWRRLYKFTIITSLQIPVNIPIWVYKAQAPPKIGIRLLGQVVVLSWEVRSEGSAACRDAGL